MPTPSQLCWTRSMQVHLTHAAVLVELPQSPTHMPHDTADRGRVISGGIPEVVDGFHCAFYLACLQIYFILHADVRPSHLLCRLTPPLADQGVYGMLWWGGCVPTITPTEVSQC